MAVQRQFNFLGQGRVDVPHLRLLESAVCGDFDALAGTMIAGGAPLVVTGFRLDPSTIGSLATSLKVIVAGSSIMHKGGSESGTIFAVPTSTAAEQLSATNPNVSGSFTNNAANYVGVDLVRAASTATQDKVAFLAADTGKESGKTVPLARLLNYRFNISTKSFSSSPNIAPMAIVQVDANGNVTSIQDARKLMFRLGAGGDVPTPGAFYSWGQRTENALPSSISSAAGTDPFLGGDKGISSFKSWMDAVMTRIWEAAGGEKWYSPAAEHDVTMVRGAGGATTFTNGDFFEWTGTNLHWKALLFLFANSTAVSNTVQDQTIDLPGTTNLAAGECLFVDLQRGTDAAVLVPQKATLASLGTGPVPGSRWVIAWRPATGGIPYTRGLPYVVGTIAPPASTTAMGLVKLASAAPTVGTPQVPTVDADTAGGTVGNVVAGGVTRAATTAGNISLGTGANDNAVNISRSGQTTTIAGGLAVGAAQTISMGSNPVTNVTNPTNPQDAATKNYVDAKVPQLAHFYYSDVAPLSDTAQGYTVSTPTEFKLTFAHNKQLGTAITADAVNNRCTINVNGTYRIRAVVSSFNTGGGTNAGLNIYIYKNGTTNMLRTPCTPSAPVGGTGTNNVSTELVLDLVATDFIEIFWLGAGTFTNGGGNGYNVRTATFTVDKVS